MPLVIFIGLLFVLLMWGVWMVVGSAILNWVFDESIPVWTDVGVVGGTNLT